MRVPKSNILRLFQKTLVTQSESLSLENSSRRKFLKNTGMIGTASLLTGTSLINLNCKNKEGKTKYDITNIAIIGGGIAGLNCAYNLQKQGMKFTIFEASKRLGGRIFTHYNDSLQNGVSPEFGGDFIDSNHEDMLNLCKEFNLDLIDLVKEEEDLGYSGDVYFFKNKSITEKEIIEEFNKISGKLQDDIISLGEDYDTPEAELLDNIPLSTYIESLECKKWLKDLLRAAFVAEFGLDCEEQSTLNLLDMINPDTSEGFQVFGDSDERFRVKGGNSRIIQELSKKIESTSIKSEHRLKSIEDVSDTKYKVTFENGYVEEFDYIVVAIPFTMLRNVELKLKNLSIDKKNCIDTLGYGQNTKLIIGYNGRPWRDSPNKNMGYLFHDTIVNGWDGSYNKNDENISGAYVCYFGGSYSTNLHLKSQKSPKAPPTHTWKTELPSEIVDDHINILETVFKNSKKAVGNSHVFVNWIDYPYTNGSYSCYKVGQWSTISGLESEPIGNIYFAGEHCSENFQGYMNGAAESGRHVAEKLIPILKKI